MTRWIGAVDEHIRAGDRSGFDLTLEQRSGGRAVTRWAEDNEPGAVPCTPRYDAGSVGWPWVATCVIALVLVAWLA